MTKYDFIIIGGGIIGMTTARELAARGASVALIDKGKLGQEASWAAGGIISSMRPWSENPASAELSEHGKMYYPQYIKALLDETEVDSEYVKSGLIIIEAKHIADINQWASSKCIKVIEKINKTSAEIKLPERAILLPEIAQLRPPRLIKALIKSLEQMSVSIFENTDITNLVKRHGRCEQLEFNGGKLSAESVIITAGAWSKRVLNDKPAKPSLESIVLDGGHYLIPRLDGHVLIGSTMEDIGFNKETTMTAQEELRGWATSIWPSLKNATLTKHWSGLRPSTDTEKPFIGPIPDFKNLYINAGHFRKGILQAPSSAILLADMFSGCSSFINRQTNLAEMV